MTYASDASIKEEYVDEGFSIKRIAERYDVSYSAIYKRIVRLGILKKDNTNNKGSITQKKLTCAFTKKLELKEKEIGEPVKSFLERKYWDEGLSPTEIGVLLNISVSSVTAWMRKLDVKMRTKSESLKLYLSKNPNAHQHTSNMFMDPAIREKSYEANRKLRQGKTIEEIHGVDEAERLRKLYSEQRKGELNPIFGTKRPQHVCDALSKAHKGKKQDPEFKVRRLKKAFEKLNISPNKLETRISEIIDQHNLPFKFVGDGSMIIHGFAPDFISTDGSMKIIEVFGDYWHGEKNPKLDYVRTEDGRKRVFADLGYDMLVLWESKINSSTDEQLHNEIISFVD